MNGASRTGLLLASAILLAWSISLAGLLAVDLARLPPGVVVLAVLLRTFLHTGLFIVAHDAMHRVLLPGQRRANDRLGGLALGLYAALPYDPCLRNHRRHHRRPGTQEDPDFLTGGGGNPLRWYLRFMGGYLSFRQMALLLGGWGTLLLAARAVSPTPALNVLVFCTLPLLLSSLQLFLFGTYLPHRQHSGREDAHHARSLDLPVWLSLAACYHFGYHREHHQFPALAWHELPRQRRQQGDASKNAAQLSRLALLNPSR